LLTVSSASGSSPPIRVIGKTRRLRSVASVHAEPAYAVSVPALWLITTTAS
jgi:hypothetical protein